MKHKEIEFNAEELVKSVESFAAHVQGRRKLTLRTRRLSLPPPIKPLRAKEIVALRLQLNVSQAVFASLLNVPKVTAISWEKGRRQPTGAALRLLDLVRTQPESASQHRPLLNKLTQAQRMAIP
jgi:putative transcriptional regulator